MSGLSHSRPHLSSLCQLWTGQLDSSVRSQLIQNQPAFRELSLPLDPLLPRAPSCFLDCSVAVPPRVVVIISRRSPSSFLLQVLSRTTVHSMRFVLCFPSTAADDAAAHHFFVAELVAEAQTERPVESIRSLRWPRERRRSFLGDIPRYYA